jgi:Regulator of G-protein signalling DHEX domain
MRLIPLFVQDYEMDALNNLKKILAGKWDFVTMQAEEQVIFYQI